ncbi:aldo/keto reductase [Micromonospora sp. RHAY321]|uniref:aldo/keto reductase n=1 Tax=Micromonospora sp. RHAY321 TaxID=2944807 RepID=UPI00207C78B3|nr:aldo/keto reductase [Micromonospora sp. RHAY321]MCO1597449.1 aldo/keto reductase [Micromonospora sp. RHAY321]
MQYATLGNTGLFVSRIALGAMTLAERHGASVAQIAIAWVLAQPGVTSAIVGARRPAQLIDNLGSLDVTLTPADLADLDAVSAPPVAYPAWLQAEVAPGRLPQQPANS